MQADWDQLVSTVQSTGKNRHCQPNINKEEIQCRTQCACCAGAAGYMQTIKVHLYYAPRNQGARTYNARLLQGADTFPQ